MKDEEIKKKETNLDENTKPKKKKFSVRNFISNLLILAAIGLILVVLGGNFITDRKMKVDVQVFADKSGDNEIIKMMNEMREEEEAKTKEEREKLEKERLEFIKKKKEIMKQYEEPIGVLEIPKVRVELPIFYNTTELNLSKGTSILKKGDFLTDNGTVEEAYDNFEDDYEYTLNSKITDKIVITGHNSTSSVNNHDMLKNVEYLEIGDFFYINNGETHQKYEVTNKKIVLPSEAGEVYEGDIDYDAMLLTCHPYTINSHRLLVYADYIGDVDNDTKDLELKDLERMSFFETYNPYNLALIFILIIVIIINIYKFIKKKKKEKEENELKEIDEVNKK